MSPLVLAALIIVPLVLIGGGIGLVFALRSDRTAPRENAATSSGSPASPGQPGRQPKNASTPPATTDPTPPTFDAKSFVGTWERDKADDGQPYRFVVRDDMLTSVTVTRKSGTLKGKDGNPLENTRENHGTLVLTQPTVRLGAWVHANLLMPQGQQSYQFRLDDADEITFQSRGKGNEPLQVTLRRTGPPGAAPPPSALLPPVHQDPYEPLPPGADGPLGRGGVTFERATVLDGMPYKINVPADGVRFVLSFLSQGGGMTADGTLMIPLDPPVTGKWFRSQFRSQATGTIYGFHIKLDGTDKLLLAPATSRNLDQDAVTLHRMARLRHGLAAPIPNTALASTAGFGTPGSPTGILAGIWNRDDVTSTHPARYEIRADGSARIVNNEKGEGLPSTVTLELPPAVGAEFKALFTVVRGEYHLQMRLDSLDKMTLLQTSGPSTTYTRAKPVPSK